jgi:2-phosphoglycerate kinase
MMQRINGFLKTQTRHYSASKTARESFTARVMLIGMPGVGKGTYAGGSAKLLDVPHFSAGGNIFLK